MAAQLPPPDKLIRELNTPDHSSGFFRELVSRESPRFQELSPIKRGSLYSECKGGDARVIAAFPNLYFLKETTPIGSNTVAGMTQSLYVIWNWSTDALAESSFNAEISYLGDAVSNPVFARVYSVRRDEYEASPSIATALPLTALLGVKITNGGVGYTTASATLLGPGIEARVEFVIADGAIIAGIVTAEGSGFTAASTIQIIGDGSGATAELIIQPAGAILTSQKKVELPDGDPFSHEFVSVLRVYELLPGPYIPFTRYDNDLGPIQGRRRAVLNTGQIGGVISATGKRNYEGRDGSSVVSWEIEETFSNGTGVPGPGGVPNPPYPVLVWDIYIDERGAVERRSQIVVATGTEIASLIRSGPFLIKTWFEPYQDNPFLLKKFVETWTEVVVSDRRVISEFGGGITRIDETTADPGVQTVDTGLRVVSSELKTKSPDEQTKRTEQLIVGEWPILHGVHTDEVTGIVVNFTKQVAPEGTGYPGRSGYRGPFVEIQTYDRWRSIQIVSAVDLNTLPGPEAWNIVHPVNFPPQLLSIEAVWSDAVSKLTNAQATSANVSVSTGAGGGVIQTSRSGFRGNTTGVQARRYIFGSPLVADIATPYKILPSSGSVVLTQTSSSTRNQKGDDGGVELSDSFQLQVHEVFIRECLVNLATLQILNATHTSPPQSAVATSGGGSVAGVAAAGTQSRMDVRIPQSTPAQLTSGQQILLQVHVSEWRFGIWVIDYIYVNIP